MCLVAFSWDNHPRYKLVLSGNRDEFLERPSETIHKWSSGIYAGKDLKGGGTWLGIHPNGRFSWITNYRYMNSKTEPEISRGHLVRDFLEGKASPYAYLAEVEKNKHLFDGFNLIVSDGDTLCYYSNYGEGIMTLDSGVYGLSNGLLNAPWPKTVHAKYEMRQMLQKEKLGSNELLGILNSKTTYPIEQLPRTGLPEDMEIQLSAQFIEVKNYYGTVNSSALVIGHDGHVDFIQRSFDQVNGKISDKQVQFRVDWEIKSEL